MKEIISAGFEDIIQSPTLIDEGAYMQVLLEPNGFITLKEHKCDIHLKETLEGLKIIAFPYDEVNGQKKEVMDFATRKGVYMMIEGAAEELNYEAEERTPYSDNAPGFNNFTKEIQRIHSLIGGSQQPTNPFCKLPNIRSNLSTGYTVSTCLVQIEEDPNYPDHTLRLWVIEDIPSASQYGPDSKTVKNWISKIRSKKARWRKSNRPPEFHKTVLIHFLKMDSTSCLNTQDAVRARNTRYSYKR